MFKNKDFFVGTVSDVSDPERSNRVAIRIFGYHDPIEDKDLPWAQTVSPITSGGKDSVGSIHGLEVGSWVIGISLDDLYQDLLVLGSLNTNKDIHERALGTSGKEYPTSSIIGIPSNPYNSEYPHNKIFASKSGHIIEFDDTEGAERIFLYHKSGSFVEMHPNGEVVHYNKNGRWIKTQGDDKLHVEGKVKIYASNDIDVDSGTKVTVNAPLIDLNP